MANAVLAPAALERLVDSAEASATDWGLGTAARSRALLSEREAAEDSYAEAIERLSRTQLCTELARAHLLYGEWLRRQGRRTDARTQLRTAHEMLDTIGMEAFAERARRELVATGGRVRKRTVETRDELTPQEQQIARLARDGLTNPEIGVRLFLSPYRRVAPEEGVRQARNQLEDEPVRCPAERGPGSHARLDARHLTRACTGAMPAPGPQDRASHHLLELK